MKQIGNFIKQIDLYGSTINLTIHHKRTSKTVIGGFITLFSIIFFIVYGIINSKNLINRLNPVVTRFALFNKQYIQVEDFFSKIPIAVSINGFDINYLIDYFTIYVYYEEYIRENWTYLDTSIISLVNCTKNHFVNVSEEIFNKEIYGNSYCLNMTELKNKSLFYSNGIEGNIYILLTYCEQLYNPKCRSKEEILNFFSIGLGDFMISIGVGGINPLNYKEPIQYFIQKKIVIPSIHFTGGYDIYIYQEELETDDGLFMKNNKITYSYNILESHSYFITDLFDSTLAYIKILPSNTSYYNKRVYTKIQDYLSQLGGMIGLAFNILPYIVYIFSIGIRDEKILNTLLEFKNDTITYDTIKNTYSFKNIFKNLSIKKGNIEKNGNLEKKTIEDSSFQINLKKNNFFSQIRNQNGNQDVDIFLDDWKKRKIKKIKFSHFEIIKLYLCNCKCIIKKTKSKKLLLYHEYKSIIGKYLEVPFLINKFEENDKLKYILFNKKELSLFKFISNDIVYSDNFTMKKNKLTLKKLFYNNDREIASKLLLFLKEKHNINRDKYVKRLVKFFYDKYQT